MRIEGSNLPNHDQGLKNVIFHTLDISNSESRTQFKEWIQKAYGGLDILVNNAGVLLSVDNVYETAVETMKINYQGTIDLTEEFLPLFKASQAGARIVNITSYVGKLMCNANAGQKRGCSRIETKGGLLHWLVEGWSHLV